MAAEREGVYFFLPEEIYHADPALGSTSIKALAVDPTEWWFDSDHNPLNADIEKERKKAFEVGDAFHKIVLEGPEALEKKYAPKLENWTTIPGKAERARFEAAGLIAIPIDDWKRITVASHVIQANPYLREAFTGGISEVSIFWTYRGIRMKARIDHLKIRANSDLKTISPQDGRPFRSSCRKQMGRYRYFVQAAHYNMGRMQLRRFLKQGKVYGDHDAALFERIVKSTAWASVFTFIKKTGAPLTYACSISAESPLLLNGQAKCETAADRYLEFVERFGLDNPWVDPQPVEELAIEELYNEDLA